MLRLLAAALALPLPTLPGREVGSSGSSCHVVADQRNVSWLRCPGRSDTMTIGVNHVSNNCRGPGVSPPRNSTTAPYADNSAICMTWDSSINRSAYRDSTLARYGSDGGWARSAASRLTSWGFNTAGAWSSTELEQPGAGLLFTLVLDMGVSWSATVARGFPDVFEQSWAASVQAIAEHECAPRRDNPNLLGYFPDNELNWFGHWPAGHGCSRQHPGNCTSTSLLTWFLLRPATSAGNLAARAFLTDRYHSLSALNAAWGTTISSWSAVGAATPFPAPTAARAKDDADFLTIVSDKYHSTVARAIRAADPNHLIIGYRLNGKHGDDPSVEPDDEILLPLVRSAAKYVDILDVSMSRLRILCVSTSSLSEAACAQYHSYSVDAPLAELRTLHENSGLPVMVSEFGFRASDSGLPNSDGAGPVVTTQAERAAGMSAYIRAMVRLPFVVGYHVFAWVDEPASGNGWQENSNYGLVHLDDDPYTAMVDMYTALHRDVAQLHAAGARPRKPDGPERPVEAG